MYHRNFLSHSSYRRASCVDNDICFAWKVQVDTWQEALEVENASPYGNAASVYTSSGAAADFFQTRFRAGMIGVIVFHFFRFV